MNCAVLDSAFSSLDKVMNTMAGQMGIPPEFVQMLMPMIQGAVAQQANMKIEDLNIEEHSKNCDVPCLFLHG